MPWSFSLRPASAMGHPAENAIGSRCRQVEVSRQRATSSACCDEEEQTRLGWSISALVHAFILAAVVVFNFHTPSDRPVPQKEPFRWEVSLQAAPQPEPVVAEAIDSPTAALAAENDPVNTADARPFERVDELLPHHEASPLQETSVPTASSRERASQTPPAHAESFEKADRLTTVAVLPGTHSTESALPPPEVESRQQSDTLQVETQRESPTVLQRPQAVSRPLMNRRTSPDYTWLMDTLRMKLERVKAYPPSAKAGHAQGRVVVQVGIHSDGRLINPEIEESSGYPVLDQAALEALRAVSPLTLDYQLESAPVVMLVPLNYQLE